MPPPESRSPLAIGFEWATRISVMGMTFVVPILAGHGLDRLFGSRPVGLLVGMVLGFLVGIIQLVQFARGSTISQRSKDLRDDRDF